MYHAKCIICKKNAEVFLEEPEEQVITLCNECEQELHNKKWVLIYSVESAKFFELRKDLVSIALKTDNFPMIITCSPRVYDKYTKLCKYM